MSASKPEIWASIAATERPASLRSLVEDLSHQTSEVGAGLRLFIVDNGRSVEARRALADGLAGASCPIVVEPASRAGGSIARSRRDQREQVRRALADHAPPAIVWMLDDDVRLEHHIVDAEHLQSRKLHNHVEFLLSLQRARPDIEVMLGQISGDPPIPAVATYASRLEDFAHALRQIATRAPDARWSVDSETLAKLGSDDAYYDFAYHDAQPGRPPVWIPRRPHAVTRDILGELVSEAADIPFGIGFSRPILTDASAFGRMRVDTIRGASAVFFAADAFLAHRYPSLALHSVETRRSDSIGSALFAKARPGRLGRSGFAVRHVRPREEAFLPSSASVVENLVADTWGAAISRAIVSTGGDTDATASFLQARLHKVDASLMRMRRAMSGLSGLLETLPSWATFTVPPSAWEHLRGRLSWIPQTVPGFHEGRLPAPWRDRLVHPESVAAIVDFARSLHEDPALESSDGDH